MEFLREVYIETGSLQNWLPPRFENSAKGNEADTRIWETRSGRIVGALTPEEKLDPDKNPMTYLADKAKEMGLILGSSPGTGILRMMPSLIITEEQVDEGLRLLEEVIGETAKKFNLSK